MCAPPPVPMPLPMPLKMSARDTLRFPLAYVLTSRHNQGMVDTLICRREGARWKIGCMYGDGTPTALVLESEHTPLWATHSQGTLTLRVLVKTDEGAHAEDHIYLWEDRTLTLQRVIPNAPVNSSKHLGGMVAWQRGSMIVREGDVARHICLPLLISSACKVGNYVFIHGGGLNVDLSLNSQAPPPDLTATDTWLPNECDFYRLDLDTLVLSVAVYDGHYIKAGSAAWEPTTNQLLTSTICNRPGAHVIMPVATCYRDVKWVVAYEAQVAQTAHKNEVHAPVIVAERNVDSEVVQFLDLDKPPPAGLEQLRESYLAAWQELGGTECPACLLTSLKTRYAGRARKVLNSIDTPAS